MRKQAVGLASRGETCEKKSPVLYPAIFALPVKCLAPAEAPHQEKRNTLLSEAEPQICIHPPLAGGGMAYLYSKPTPQAYLLGWHHNLKQLASSA